MAIRAPLPERHFWVYFDELMSFWDFQPNIFQQLNIWAHQMAVKLFIHFIILKIHIYKIECNKYKLF